MTGLEPLDVDLELLAALDQHRSEVGHVERSRRVATTEPEYRTKYKSAMDRLLDQRLALSEKGVGE